jgi:thioredoxin-like negative regulator of GroEL
MLARMRCVVPVRREDVGDAEHHLAAVPLELEVAEVQLLVHAHEQLAHGQAVGGGHLERGIGHDADDVRLAEDLHVQRDFRVVRLEVALDDVVLRDFAVVPAHFLEGAEGGGVKGGHQVI